MYERERISCVSESGREGDMYENGEGIEERRRGNDTLYMYVCRSSVYTIRTRNYNPSYSICI